MRKLIGLMLLLGLFSLAAVAQENYSKAEVFGGYQYTRFDGGVNANGFNGALTGNLNHWFGVAADFRPQVAMRRGGAFTPFAHALFGGFHSSASASGISASDSGFAFMLGGGADVKVAPAISVRLLQFDWLSLHANGNSDNNIMRLSTGVVFHF